MRVAVSEFIIVLVGVLAAAMSVWGVFVPNKLIPLVRAVMENGSGVYVAVGVRLLLGLALILAAPESKFPFIFNIIGVFAIVAAIVIPFVGRARIVGMIAWFERSPPVMIRGWLLFGFAFGAFLVYGVLAAPN
jgi:hypothetical protein